MSPARKAAVQMALAASGATLIVFIGICHEFVGSALFPWGPALFGGALGWHAVGVGCIVAGLAVLGGTLQLYAFPVVPFAAFGCAVGLALVAYTAVVHRQFHLFALAAAVASAVTAANHRPI